MRLLLTIGETSMDFRAIIELVKYTLALTAACFVYSLEKLDPHSTPGGRWLVFCLLVALGLSACFGVVIFSASTAGLHGDENRAKRQKPRIEKAAFFHVVLLVSGMIVLSGVLAYRVLYEPPKPLQVCCQGAASNSTDK